MNEPVTTARQAFSNLNSKHNDNKELSVRRIRYLVGAMLTNLPNPERGKDCLKNWFVSPDDGRGLDVLVENMSSALRASCTPEANSTNTRRKVQAKYLDKVLHRLRVETL